MADESTENTTNEQQNAQPPQRSGSQKIMAYFTENKVTAVMTLTRLFSIVCAVLFILPIFGGNSYSFYQRCLIANAATSALRLHQRLNGQFQLSREFFGRMFMEDSAHYLFYSLMFATSYPVTLAVVPVALFAVIHSATTCIKVLNEAGPQSMPMLRNLANKVLTNSEQLFRFVACSEIFLMPVILLLMFTGNTSLFLPFVYYRFLSLRYASQRNRFSRMVFYELHVSALHLAGNPRCPGIVSTIIHKAIALISRLAPQPQPAQ